MRGEVDFAASLRDMLSGNAFGDAGARVVIEEFLDGEEATVKEFHRDSSGVWLLPHNDAYSPIKGDEAEIMGKVVSVLRAV